MVNVSVKFGNTKFRNPTVVASGLVPNKSAVLQSMASTSRVGGFTAKSVWLNEHKGHDAPVIVPDPKGYYYLNAVGLPSPKYDEVKPELEKYIEWNKSQEEDSKAPLVLSIAGGTIDEFVEVAKKAAELDVGIIEVNISCPNVSSEFGIPFSCSTDDASTVTREVVQIVKDVNPEIKTIVKLSPNVTDIKSIALGCAKAGADGFCLINTAGPGLALNLDTREPILTNGVGGISGPALKPLAVRIISDIYKATGGEKLIIGTGGVMTAEDAIEMMMVGATLIGVGTGIYYKKYDVFTEIEEGMKKWCEEQGIENLEEIIGTAKV
jgi:dihydroorotate dehydrogenase (NAD+) catalytic subunit